jgi:hypothetical protein
LATTIAERTPTTVSHHGAMGGKVSAISQAVTSAEPSPRNIMTGLPRSLSIAASASSAVTDAKAICTRTAAPKNQTYTAMPGSSASSTRNITDWTLAGLRK